MLCPRDLKPCIDNMCRGTQTCFFTGEAMCERCPGCKRLVSADDRDDCDCEPDYDDNREDIEYDREYE